MKSFATRTLVAFAFAALDITARADVVLDWHHALLEITAESNGSLPPFLEARVAAITYGAMQTAIAAANSAASSRDRSELQQAAATSAACSALTELRPSEAAKFTALEARHLGIIGSEAARTRGMRLGRDAAARVLEPRLNDGWCGLVMLFPPEGPVPDRAAAVSEALLSGAPAPLSPWLKLKPFGLKTMAQVPAEEIQIRGHDGSTVNNYPLIHSRLFKNIDRTAPAGELARAWSESPVIRWNQIAASALAQSAADLATQARVFAALNAALADAAVAAQHARFTLGSWRELSVDVMEELNGMPPLATDLVVQVTDGLGPRLVRRELRRVLIAPTPNYPSLRATLAGAGQAALIAACKSDRILITVPVLSHNAEGSKHISRSFGSFSEAAREGAFVASLDGRHSREACIAGYQLGAEIGSYVAQRTMRNR